MSPPAAGSPPPSSPQRLAPVLGIWTALALVVGEVIGSGVFLKPSQVAAATGGYVGLILTLWVVCGLVNLCGALTLAELSAMLPHAGGTYLFLREAYGRLWGFLWGWAEFWVIRTGAIAALAAALAIFLGELLVQFDLFEPGAGRRGFERTVSVGTIALVATVNILGTRWGGAVQVATSVVKAGFLGFLGLLPFLVAEAPQVSLGTLWPEEVDRGLLAGLGSALAGIMWAYDGWGQVTVVAEEIRHPQRNVPLALTGGVVLLIVLYTGANLAYHLTLPSSEIARSPAVAVDVTRALLGDFGTRLMTAMLLVSVFGALNSNILVGPRVSFAVARDHEFLRPLRHIDPRFGTPALAIAALATWAVVLTLAGDLPNLLRDLPADGPPPKRLFDVLTDYAIFGGSMFYLAAVAAVFVLRFRRPEAPRPYRTWGYPLVPAIFVAAYVVLLVSMFAAAPAECSLGLLLIAAGMVVYAVLGQRKPSQGLPPHDQGPGDHAGD